MRSLALCALCALWGACGAEPDLEHPSWRYIHAAIVIPNCATSGCHSTLSQISRIDLQDRDNALKIFRVETERANPLLLIRGGYEQNHRMPPDQPLPNGDIDLIQRWADDGKPDN
jgi:hypothetical protein